MRIQKIGDHELPPPVRATPGSCGFDLQASSDAVVYPGTPTMIGTGYAWEIDLGYADGIPDVGIPVTEYGLIRDRSSLARRGLIVVGGIVDGDYRGEVKVLLLNATDQVQTIRTGDKIAQMIVSVAAIRPLEVISAEAVLSATRRQAQGFGSSGA